MTNDRLTLLLEALDDPKVSVQWNASRELARLGAEAIVAAPALRRMAESKDATSRVWAHFALLKLEDPVEDAVEAGLKDHLPHIIDALGDPRVFPGMAAAALAGIGPAARSSVPKLLDSLKSERPDDRWSAIWALGNIGVANTAIVAALVPALNSADEKERWYAAWALGEFGCAASLAKPALIECLTDFDDDVRGYAARALAAIGGELPNEALAILDEMIADDNPSISEAATTAKEAHKRGGVEADLG